MSIFTKSCRSSHLLQLDEAEGASRAVGGEGEMVTGAGRAAHCEQQAVSIRPRVRWILILAHATMQPLMTLWHLGVADSWANWPHAEDAPYCYIPGPGPDRVLVLGSHTPAGFGVITHELGLVGNLSRYVQNITGRGIEMEACTDVNMTLHDLVGRVHNLPPVSSGAVMVLVGLNDALRFTSLREWKKDLRALSEVIRRHTVGDVHIVIVEIPRVDMLRTLRPLPKRIAARHARLLNETTKQFCLHLTSTQFVPFPSVKTEGKPALHSWTPGMYKELSRELAVPLAEALRRAQH
jgi:hypothetical protein